MTKTMTKDELHKRDLADLPAAKRDLLSYLICKNRVANAAIPGPAEEWTADALSAWQAVRDTGVRWRTFMFARDQWRPFPGFDMELAPGDAEEMARLANEYDPADDVELGYDPNEDDGDWPAG